MIRLDTWVREGGQHPQRTQRFVMVTYYFLSREVSQLCLSVLGQLIDTPRPKSTLLSQPRLDLG
jgi:hypothetical protein